MGWREMICIVFGSFAILLTQVVLAKVMCMNFSVKGGELTDKSKELELCV